MMQRSEIGQYIVMSLIVKGGMGSISKGGKLKEMCVKTEWKNILKKLAFSISEVAIRESRLTVGGIVSCLAMLLMYIP